VRSKLPLVMHGQGTGVTEMRRKVFLSVCNGWQEMTTSRTRSLGRNIAGALLVLGASVSALAQAQPQPQVVAAGLEHPWAVAFLPEQRFLVTERPGRLRVVEADGRLGEPVAGVPAVAAGGQGGLLDVATDSEFARN